MDYNNGPMNPGYAPSNVSSPVPPGMSVTGSQQPNYNPNAQYGGMQRGNGGGGGCCQGGVLACIQRNNPFEKANTITDDVYYNARYKRAMGVAIASMLTTAVGSIIVTGEGCVFANIMPIFHLFPVFMPSCNRKAYPYYWSFISIGSMILAGVTLFIGLIQGCEAEAAIVAGITILIELVMLFILYRMDPELKEKVKYCFASCGCLGEQAQMQTMVPKETNYGTSAPVSPQMGYNNGGYNGGYDGASNAGSLGPGSYVGGKPGGPNNFPSPPGSVNGGTFGRNQAQGTYSPNFTATPTPPPQATNAYNNRNSAGKGSLILDAPEFEGASHTGY